MINEADEADKNTRHEVLYTIQLSGGKFEIRDKVIRGHVKKVRFTRYFIQLRLNIH